eukprot:m.3347 g.3347  ORF g.3347 m.3347 type:complete len:53 (+) comp5100_c0_seq1:505-663(+)
MAVTMLGSNTSTVVSYTKHQFQYIAGKEYGPNHQHLSLHRSQTHLQTGFDAH